MRSRSSIHGMNERTLIYLLLAAFLGGMAAYMISVVRQAEPAIKAECIDPELQQKIRSLAQDGFEQAFKHRAELLFDNWTKDDPRNHPSRGQVGMENAIHAYIYARELAANWSAAPCPAKPVGLP